jgi:hypothetical protein
MYTGSLLINNQAEPLNAPLLNQPMTKYNATHRSSSHEVRPWVQPGLVMHVFSPEHLPVPGQLLHHCQQQLRCCWPGRGQHQIGRWHLLLPWQAHHQQRQPGWLQRRHQRQTGHWPCCLPVSGLGPELQLNLVRLLQSPADGKGGHPRPRSGTIHACTCHCASNPSGGNHHPAEAPCLERAWLQESLSTSRIRAQQQSRQRAADGPEMSTGNSGKPDTGRATCRNKLLLCLLLC